MKNDRGGEGAGGWLRMRSEKINITCLFVCSSYYHHPIHTNRKRERGTCTILSARQKERELLQNIVEL